MILKIRYENGYQTVVLNEEETEQLWISLSLEDEPGVPREERIQSAFEKVFNKPEYNAWHKEVRHIQAVRCVKRRDGKPGLRGEESRDLENIAIQEDAVPMLYDEMEYEEICLLVREALGKKQDWADMFIAIRLNGEKIRDYAARNGISENSVTQKLNRATKKLRKVFTKRKGNGSVEH